MQNNNQNWNITITGSIYGNVVAGNGNNVNIQQYRQHPRQRLKRRRRQLLKKEDRKETHKSGQKVETSEAKATTSTDHAVLTVERHHRAASPIFLDRDDVLTEKLMTMVHNAYDDLCELSEGKCWPAEVRYAKLEQFIIAPVVAAFAAVMARKVHGESTTEPRPLKRMQEIAVSAEERATFADKTRKPEKTAFERENAAFREPSSPNGESGRELLSPKGKSRKELVSPTKKLVSPKTELVVPKSQKAAYSKDEAGFAIKSARFSEGRKSKKAAFSEDDAGSADRKAFAEERAACVEDGAGFNRQMELEKKIPEIVNGQYWNDWHTAYSSDYNDGGYRSNGCEALWCDGTKCTATEAEDRAGGCSDVNDKHQDDIKKKKAAHDESHDICVITQCLFPARGSRCVCVWCLTYPPLLGRIDDATAIN
ncbi:hypothetical protein FN846DRAFT_885761 [Sphaerosporella brunnea]|uniref:Uncharacterized protein n=1 Tax=Sphaerosporella brunnea TaxID=1250544 RepID=A0A5J5FBU0_9PEZI|nr:hypothetical protein FN846DRAFT_885761 [Sphaerosporella brunnea]